MRRRLGADPQTLLLLIVANNFLLKGVATLLRMLARLRGRHLPVRLAVVGGKRLGPWRRLAARLGVGDAVQFIGPVENTLAYYAAADLYVHPTIYDTCSLVVLEAAACGLPIVTTRCNGAAELFHEGRDMLLVSEPADDAAFAAQVETLLSAEVRRALGDAARRTALTRTFDQNVDDVVALYREVVEQRRRRRSGGPVVWSGRVPASPPAFVVPRPGDCPDFRGRTPQKWDCPPSVPAPREEGVFP
jgi:UDP-glucose:(heptosyl)LPS alpha-1,3-glucosyltransferase